MADGADFDFGSPAGAAPPADFGAPAPVAAAAPMDFDQFTAPAAPAASNSMDAFDAAVDDAPAPVAVAAGYQSPAGPLPAQATSDPFMDAGTPAPAPAKPQANGINADDAMSPGMKKWQDEQDEKIQAAKQAEETAKTTSRQQNAAWLKEFNAEWASKSSKRKQANRLEHKTGATHAKSWEGVCSLLDMEYQGTKDVSRMKSLLIQVKNSPPAN